MNICNDKHHDKPSTSRQLFSHVKKSETTMHDVRDLMLDILVQYQKVDKVGFSLGVLDKSASFSDKVSWCSIIGKLDHHKQTLDKMSKDDFVKLVDYLDELTATFSEKVVLKIQQYRDLWMKRVLMWDLLIFVLILFGAAAGLYWSGVGFDSGSYIDFIKQRPAFSSLIALAGVAILLMSHFLTRRTVINNILSDIEDEFPAGMSLANALNSNARIRHSIFRPTPVGWSFLQRQRIEAISQKLLDIRDKLADVLANYTDSKAA